MRPRVEQLAALGARLGQQLRLAAVRIDAVETARSRRHDRAVDGRMAGSLRDLARDWRVVRRRRLAAAAYRHDGTADGGGQGAAGLTGYPVGTTRLRTPAIRSRAALADVNDLPNVDGPQRID